jgi:hypothetical protein
MGSATPDVRCASDESAIRTELSRILSSPVFADADRLCRFLAFVVEESLAGRAGILKESVIGTEVFAREAGYDPKADPIVRVQARRLRVKLDTYYSSAGPGLRITLPKGGYAPEFVIVEDEIPAPIADIPTPASRPRTATALGWMTAALVLALAILAIDFLNPRPEHPSTTRIFTSLTGYQTTPAFSPDGSAIVFGWDGPSSGNNDIYVQRVDGDSPTRLTTAAETDARPVWLSSGREIGFVRKEGAGAASVMQMNVDGSNQRRVAQIALAGDTIPRVDWSADGARIYTSEPAARTHTPRIVEIEIASGRRRVLTEPPASSLGDDEATLSWDGRRLAFRRRSEASIDDVWAVAVAGGAAHPVTNDGAATIAR